ncbi:phosphotransferase enzyme family protein, partial [Coniochaeta ligniaria NRRL 30616]
AEDLPAPLPTVAEIKSSHGPDVLDERSGVVKVVRVNQHFAVKYGWQVHLVEGDSMIFVAKSTKIRVPKVYAMFTEVSTNLKFIVMEYISGKTLADRWEELDQDQKQAIATQLRRYFDELRSLPSPGYFGSIDGSGLGHPFFHPAGDDGTFSGPFETEVELLQALVAIPRHERLKSNPVYERGNYVESGLMAVFRGHKTVFTHGDLHRGNVIIQDDGGVAVLDWAWAGWYPCFWEYCTAIWACMGFRDNWHSWVAKILDPYHAEAAWFHIVY